MFLCSRRTQKHRNTIHPPFFYRTLTCTKAVRCPQSPEGFFSRKNFSKWNKVCTPVRGQPKHILKCKLHLLKEGKDLDCSLLIKRTEPKTARSLKTLSEGVLEASIQDLFSVSLYQCPSISPFTLSPAGLAARNNVYPRAVQTSQLTDTGRAYGQSSGEIRNVYTRFQYRTEHRKQRQLESRRGRES